VIKLKDLLTEKVSGRNFRPKNPWDRETYEDFHDDYLDDLEFAMWKEFGNKKDPWQTDDKIKQKVNDFILSIIKQHWEFLGKLVGKYSGVKPQALIKIAKANKLKPLRKPLKGYGG
jgi:hypothetical protein